MSYNYNHVIGALAAPQPPTIPRRSSPGNPSSSSSPPRYACASSPVLLQPLPPTLTLQKESIAQSELELDRQAAQRRRERELAEALQDATHQVERIAAREEVGTWARLRDRVKRGSMSSSTSGKEASVPFTRPPQAYELYKAIDGHDLDYIARVRDHSFGLLLQRHGGEFPLLYAARIGPSHRDIVILLIGAFSRFVNHLDEEDFNKPHTIGTLRALRANLKLAIDNSLVSAETSGSSLISSYLQVLIMSEGDQWITRSAHDLGLLLRSTHSTPVAEAEAMVRRFCTKELRGVPGGVGGVEDYVANATIDLVMQAAWGIAATQIDAEPLPTYTFARDLRTWQMLGEAMDENRAKMHKVSKRVRDVLNAVIEYGGDQKKGVRERVKEVRAVVDKAV